MPGAGGLPIPCSAAGRHRWAPVPQSAEGADSKPAQCAFESHRGHSLASGPVTSPQGYGPDHATPLRFGLHHVQLAIPAGSEDACRGFYVDLLGMREVAKPPVLAARGGLWVRADGLELHLGVEEGFRPARKAHPGIRVVGLDTLATRLAEAGVAVRRDADFPGHRRCYADDPVGNRLEFIERDASIPSW
jgi:catechol 2,3-dioxygenase-like lactoylglutathione lyase family enzyme